MSNKSIFLNGLMLGVAFFSGGIAGVAWCLFILGIFWLASRGFDSVADFVAGWRKGRAERALNEQTEATVKVRRPRPSYLRVIK